MDDFPGLLARDFGYKPQGKSAPMAPNRTTATTSAAHSSFDFGLLGSRSSSTSAKSTPIFDDHPRSGGASDDIFNDVFARPSSESRTSGGSGGFDYDSVFKEQNNTKSTSLDYDAVFREHKNAKTSSLPVFDKPVYDDDADIFDGLPGVKSASSTKFDDLFSSIGTATSPPKVKNQTNSSPFDDLLGNLGKKEAETKKESSKATNDSPAFDDLLPGFGRSSSPGSSRSASGSGQPPRSSSNTTKVDSHLDDPFSVFESTSTPVNSSASAFTDPLEEISKFSSSGSATFDDSSNKAAFDDIDPLDSLGRTAPPVASETNKRGKDRSPLGTGKSMDDTYSDITKQPVDKYPVDHSDEIHSQRKMPNDNFQDAHETMFDIPTGSADFNRFVGQNVAPPSYENVSPKPDDSSSFPRSNHIPESSDDIWLTVSEVPLYTQTTSAPPPSRPPPPRPPRKSKSDSGSSSSFNVRKNVDEYSSFSNTYNQSSGSARSAMSPPASQLDELEDFAMGRSRTNVNTDGLSAEDLDATSATAAMKEAMDKAEAKFRQMREREYAKAGRGKEGGQLDRDLREKQERLDRERIQREREEEEREREKAHQIEREREEKEREQRRLEQRAKEIERERARQAVERATREARERAAADARARAERAQAGRAAAEARERAERAAVQRAQAEARERAAAEARERAEKAAAEARERANAEAREKAAATAKAETDARRKSERAAVERAAAEARERAAAEARERAAAAARASQQKSENDLESFFQSRASSAPKSRTSAPDPFFENQNKGGPEVARRTSVSTTASMKKASSTTNIVDDLSAIFGAPSSAGEFQEVEGESEERRRARLERHQRTQERAAKALAEKNERDLQVQREQAERHRIAETLDAEIKRWAAGKEGNLRALLSTMQYVLWPECGWQPVSLTDLITAAAVKKVYRKATLCIHPDKVQQKGANLQQKYIAEKVFDLLKEAWNKFNSEELF